MAKYSLQYNNFHTIQQILGALNSNCILRLKNTWKYVKPKHLKYFSDLKTLLSPAQSFMLLRQRINGAKLPCLPYVGMFLTDMTFLKEGNRTYLPVAVNGVVNCNKVKLCAECVMHLMKYLEVGYNFTKVDIIYNFIINNTTSVYADDAEQHKRSLILEPRQAS